MGTEAVDRFLELTGLDGALEAALDEAAERGDDVASAAVALAAERGLEFAPEEFLSRVEAARAALSGQLDDAELQGVSGGFNPQPEPPAVGPSAPPWISHGWTSGLTFGR